MFSERRFKTERLTDEHLEKDMKAAVNRKVQCPVQLLHFSYTIYKIPCLCTSVQLTSQLLYLL